MQVAKFETLSIRNHPELNERWVQDRIAEDPKILGLGDVILRDRERPQPRAGRLDLLLQDADGNRRYEVEVQLGPTDESHIIRAIEYWDIERKRYPQYEHTAVIVAEEVTGRFLNVISLFNGAIPLVAIQMKAMRLDQKVGLVFTKVLDCLQLGSAEDDEPEPVDRAYWEKQRGTKSSVAIVDELLELARAHDPQLELKYNKFYIGLAKHGRPCNFVIFRPARSFTKLEPRIPSSESTRQRLEDAGLDLLEYDSRWGRYRIRLKPGDVKKHREILASLIEEAYDLSGID